MMSKTKKTKYGSGSSHDRWAQTDWRGSRHSQQEVQLC